MTPARAEGSPCADAESVEPAPGVLAGLASPVFSDDDPSDEVLDAVTARERVRLVFHGRTPGAEQDRADVQALAASAGIPVRDAVFLRLMRQGRLRYGGSNTAAWLGRVQRLRESEPLVRVLEQEWPNWRSATAKVLDAAAPQGPAARAVSPDGLQGSDFSGWMIQSRRRLRRGRLADADVESLDEAWLGWRVSVDRRRLESVQALIGLARGDTSVSTPGDAELFAALRTIRGHAAIHPLLSQVEGALSAAAPGWRSDPPALVVSQLQAQSRAPITIAVITEAVARHSAGFRFWLEKVRDLARHDALTSAEVASLDRELPGWRTDPAASIRGQWAPADADGVRKLLKRRWRGREGNRLLANVTRWKVLHDAGLLPEAVIVVLDEVVPFWRFPDPRSAMLGYRRRGSWAHPGLASEITALIDGETPGQASPLLARLRSAEARHLIAPPIAAELDAALPGWRSASAREIRQARRHADLAPAPALVSAEWLTGLTPLRFERWLAARRRALASRTLDPREARHLDVLIPQWRHALPSVVQRTLAGLPLLLQHLEPAEAASRVIDNGANFNANQWLELRYRRLRSGLMTEAQIAELDDLLPGWRDGATLASIRAARLDRRQAASSPA